MGESAPTRFGLTACNQRPPRVLGAPLVVALALASTLAAVCAERAFGQVAQPRLSIVVVEGEDAVNVIQQKTAVAPVVEVRDQNGQPVAGAVVRFEVTRGRATFSGARTLTVTTNAAGRAAVTGFTPTSLGMLQLSASASLQGQTAVAAITLTSVSTAAQAAAVGAAGAGSGAASASGTAAGVGAESAGGDMSAATIGAIGGAAAAGALGAAKALDIGPFASGHSYEGTFTGQLVLTTNGVTGGGTAYTCVSTSTISGRLTIALEEGSGMVTGSGSTDATQVETSRSGGNFCSGGLGHRRGVSAAPCRARPRASRSHKTSRPTSSALERRTSKHSRWCSQEASRATSYREA